MSKDGLLALCQQGQGPQTAFIGRETFAGKLSETLVANKEDRELCPDVSEKTIRRDLADLVQKDILLKAGYQRGIFYIFKC